MPANSKPVFRGAVYADVPPQRPHARRRIRSDS